MKPSGYLGRTPVGDLYECRYGGGVAVEKYFTFVAMIVPQVSGSEAMKDTPTSKAARKESVRRFHEVDANCNTCRHFSRLHADNARGSSAAANFVYGDCLNHEGTPERSPYYGRQHTFQIMTHVADFVGMPCYEGRT